MLEEVAPDELGCNHHQHVEPNNAGGMTASALLSQERRAQPFTSLVG